MRNQRLGEYLFRRFTLRTSMPSKIIASTARSTCITLSFIGNSGNRNRPSSRRFASKQNPPVSHHKSFIRSRFAFRNTNKSPESGCNESELLTIAESPSKLLRISTACVQRTIRPLAGRFSMVVIAKATTNAPYQNQWGLLCGNDP